MSFPNVIYGDHGFEKSRSTTKKNAFGTKLVLPDGREFVYCLAGEAITAGKLTMSATEPAGDHDTDLAVASAAAVGDKTITLTNGGSTAVTANQFDDGYLYVNDVAGEGQTFKIKSHSTAATGASLTITLHDNDSVATALTTSSQCGIQKALGSNVEVWDASDIDGIVLGVPNADVASGEYFWNQVKGVASVLINGSVVLGKNVMSGSTTDGSVDVMADDSSAEFLVGGVIAVAPTTEYGLVDLNIRG
tara:strand:- start:6363 stop:7106 length:744 start_codon:yes stop_codon:yes gene_type:complete